MSRIDKATLQLTNATGSNAVKVRVYARNYNVLRIMSGINYSASKCQKHLLVIFLIHLSVEQKQIATFSNCGKLLRVFITIGYKKLQPRTRLIAVPSKNIKNWTIRSQGSKVCIHTMNKVQRLNGNGELVHLTNFLRYSLNPVCKFTNLNISKERVFIGEERHIHHKLPFYNHNSNVIKTNKYLYKKYLLVSL